jgi:hypothetical protein
MRNISARKKNGKEIQHLHYTITIVFDGGSNVYSERGLVHEAGRNSN